MVSSYVAAFRAYLWDDEIAELAKRFFAACPSARRVVLIDETRGPIAIPYEKVSHTDDTRSLGLPSYPKGNSLWYNGDYAIFFLKRALPDFDYYLISEFDLAVNLSCEPIIAKVAERKIDAVVHNLQRSTPDWHWHDSSAAVFANPWRAFLYFMCLSSRAIDTLLVARQRMARRFAAGIIKEWPICESFIPTVLKATPGMQFADVSEFASVENLHHRPRISLRDPRANRAGSLAHSVLGSKRFVASLLEEFDARDYFQLGSELRQGLDQEPFEFILRPLHEALVQSGDDAALTRLQREIATRGLPPQPISERPDGAPALRNRTMPAVDPVIHSMCVGELAVWQARRVDYAAALAEYEAYNNNRGSLFLLRIEGGTVSIQDKPAFFTREQLADPESPSAVIRDAHMYRAFFQDVVQTICPEVEIVLAVDLDDHGYSSETAPIFVIEKLSGSNAVMLPHFEFMLYDFHASSFDGVPFADKSPSAIFAGSTTGYYGLISADTVQKLAFPRLRAAMFFKDNPHVDFRLPRIVQSTPEGERLLKDMGFGSGEEVSWQEQFAHKFIISMDGNTASCSRVSEILKSNSVLLKYESQHLLHYSRHLVPWLHYVPINRDADVLAILDIERRNPGFFEAVSTAGKKFFDDFLHKERIFEYTGALLRMYAESFAEHRLGAQDVIVRAPAPENQPPAPHAGAFLMVSRADVIEAYRAVLDRDPESEDAIRDHMAAATIGELYQGLIESEEFEDNFRERLELPERPPAAVAIPAPKPLDWPPIDVEATAADVNQLNRMFVRVSTAWTRLGEVDPYFSVCTDPRLLGTDIGAEADEFYATGLNELRNLTSFAARSGIDLTGRTCLEFGCGVGRVTRWLAPLFRRVQAVDISPGHLAIAEAALADANVENVSLTQITSLENLQQIVGYDVFFSILVLQHNPPPLMAYCLAQMLSNLSPGGVALFQVPTYAVDYVFHVDDYLNTPVPDEPEIEMHVLPQRDILRIVQGTGCRILELREDHYTGNRDGISNTFFVQKDAR